MGIIKGIKIEKVEVPKFEKVEIPSFKFRAENYFPLVGKDLQGDLAESGARLKEMTITPRPPNPGVKYMDFGTLPLPQEKALVPLNAQNALVKKTDVQRVDELEQISSRFGMLAGCLGSMAIASGAPAAFWAFPVMGVLLLFPRARRRLATGLVGIERAIIDWKDRTSLQISFQKLSQPGTNQKERDREIQNIRSIAEKNPAAFDQSFSHRLLDNLATLENPELIGLIPFLISKNNEAVTSGLLSSMALGEFKREGLEDIFFQLLDLENPLGLSILETMIRAAVVVEAFHRKRLSEKEQLWRQESEPLREAAAWSRLVRRMKKAYDLKILNMIEVVEMH